MLSTVDDCETDSMQSIMKIQKEDAGDVAHVFGLNDFKVLFVYP